MKQILVIDNDIATQEAAAAIFRESGCGVRSAPNVEQALSQLNEGMPDAVLVSLTVPEMADSTFVETWRDDPWLGRVPLVVLAATPRAAVGSIRDGARGVIRPIDAGGVVAALPEALRSSID